MTNIVDLREAVAQGRVVWRQHALMQMMTREISTADVRQVLMTGEVIEDYPGDAPYPSALYMGFSGTRPLHVVVAYNEQSRYAYVITAYQPDRRRFELDFRTRTR